MKVLVVFGTRPEAIKLFPVIKKMKERGIEVVVCSTGQHDSLLYQDVVLPFKKRGYSELCPKYDLKVMKPGQSLGKLTSSILSKAEKIIEKEKPDFVMVHGDTSTTFSFALAAFYCKVKIIHVEAGLRTHDKFSPFPEEMNRRFVDQIADWHFAPTCQAYMNLQRENIPISSSVVVGNTVIDNFQYTLSDDYDLGDWKSKIVVVTVHRRESWDTLDNFFMFLNRFAKQHEDFTFIYPVHKNPLLIKKANQFLSNVCLTSSMNVFDMHNLLNHASFIMTDSGGLQEECTFLEKPVIVLRNESERTGNNLFVTGFDEQKIQNAFQKIQMNEFDCDKYQYGKGKASNKIVHCLLKTECRD